MKSLELWNLNPLPFTSPAMRNKQFASERGLEHGERHLSGTSKQVTPSESWEWTVILRKILLDLQGSHKAQCASSLMLLESEVCSGLKKITKPPPKVQLLTRWTQPPHTKSLTEENSISRHKCYFPQSHYSPHNVQDSIKKDETHKKETHLHTLSGIK